MAAWLAKIGAGLGKVSPEAWKAGALVTDKLSGGAGGGIGRELANADINLSGGLRRGTKSETKNGASKGAKSIAFGSGNTESGSVNAEAAETSKTNLIGKG